MLGLVVSENLLTLFISWEIMGLCSYLLIGFWWAKNYPDPKKITPREAGLKAFIVTKIGDLFFLLGHPLPLQPDRLAELRGGLQPRGAAHSG